MLENFTASGQNESLSEYKNRNSKLRSDLVQYIAISQKKVTIDI